MTSPYAKAFTDEEVADFWETHAGDNPECDTCRWLLTLTYPSKREPARTAGDPRVAISREDLRGVFHDEYDRMSAFSCVHQNQHPASWDCEKRVREIFAALSEASSVREPEETK